MEIKDFLNAESKSVLADFKKRKLLSSSSDAEALNSLIEIHGIVVAMQQAAKVESVLELLEQRNELLAAFELFLQDGKTLQFEIAVEQVMKKINK